MLIATTTEYGKTKKLPIHNSINGLIKFKRQTVENPLMQKIRNDILLNTSYNSSFFKVAIAFPMLASAPIMKRFTNMAIVVIIRI